MIHREIECIECGEKFLKKNKKHRLCSKKCREIVRERENKKNRKTSFSKGDTNNCLRCGEKFIMKRFNQCFCSYKCRNGKQNISRKVRCKECSKEFFTFLSKQVFCSDPYSKKFHKRNSSKQNNTYQNFLKRRFKVLKRDGFKCVYCGRDSKKDNNIILHIDHLIPRSKGGSDEINNLVTSCIECNLGKGDILLEERKLKKLKLK